MPLRGRVLAVLAACAPIVAEHADSQGLNASNNSSLNIVAAMEAEANTSDSLSTVATEHLVNASDAQLLRPASKDDALDSMNLQEAAAQEMGWNASARSKDAKAGEESSSLETIVASVSADGTISEELAMNDTSEQLADDSQDDYDLVVEYNEDELDNAANVSETVAAEAPSGRKRSSMVRSERLSPDLSLGLASSMLAEAAEAINSTMSMDVRPNLKASVWNDFRTLFVLLFVLCFPLVAILVVANLCMGLDIPKPRPMSITKFPHPAGLDAVRRRPLVK